MFLAFGYLSVQIVIHACVVAALGVFEVVFFHAVVNVENAAVAGGHEGSVHFGSFDWSALIEERPIHITRCVESRSLILA